MPYYGRPVDVTGVEEVGFGFNRDIITGLLREQLGFDGVVCTDWKLLTDAIVNGGLIEAKCWGVEGLDVSARIVKALDAGIDQFGGEHCTDVLLELVRTGTVSEERIDVSARRLLRDKFRLGLFDNPYVDPDCAVKLVGAANLVENGKVAQRRSIVLLKNGSLDGADAPLVPLPATTRIYVEGVDRTAAARYATLVSLEEADVAILRVAAPYEPRSGSYIRAVLPRG